MAELTILIWLLIFIVVAGVLIWVIDLIPNPPLTPVLRGLAKAIVVLILLLVFLRHVGFV